MTRINCGIPVEALTDEHLLAEHREIKRLPDSFIKALDSGALGRIPSEFCLGPGHVTFFLNKQRYVFLRYVKIYGECLKRGFNVEAYHENWTRLQRAFEHYDCWCSYWPRFAEFNLVKHRIEERIKNSPKVSWHYYGKAITKDEAIYLLNKIKYYE